MTSRGCACVRACVRACACVCRRAWRPSTCSTAPLGDVPPLSQWCTPSLQAGMAAEHLQHCLRDLTHHLPEFVKALAPLSRICDAINSEPYAASEKHRSFD